MKDWSLATIYKGMFEFMVLQCIAIALIVAFPPIATWFPEHLQHEARQIKTEDVDDSDEPPGGRPAEGGAGTAGGGAGPRKRRNVDPKKK